MTQKTDDSGFRSSARAGSSPNKGEDEAMKTPSFAAGATPLKDEIATGARELTAEIKHMAGDVADGAKKAAESKLDTGKDFATEHLGAVAHALRSTVRELRENESAATDYVEMAATSVEKVSDYLQKRTLSQLLGDVEGYARREPAVFLGGAFFAGLLGGRFFKSAAPAKNATRSERTPSQPTYRALPPYDRNASTQGRPTKSESGRANQKKEGASSASNERASERGTGSDRSRAETSSNESKDVGVATPRTSPKIETEGENGTRARKGTEVS